MTQEDSLLRAVLRDPPDDTVRLAYADYLDETATGSDSRRERAEFIRLQIALEHTEHDCCRASEVYLCRAGGLCPNSGARNRAHELITAHEHRWRGRALNKCELVGRWLSGRDLEPQYVGNDRTRVYRVNCTWSRGFVSEVHGDMADLISSPCTRCDVTNTVCPVCGDKDRDYQPTGTSPGIVGAFELHPVATVTVADRTPAGQYNGRTPYFWCAATLPSRLGYPWYLPPAVFGALKKFTVHDAPPATPAARFYYTERDAREDLSDALVSLFRKGAGLE